MTRKGGDVLAAHVDQIAKNPKYLEQEPNLGPVWKEQHGKDEQDQDTSASK